MASQYDLDVAALMRRSVINLDDASIAAYDAPFPDKHYKAGVRRFPEIVPTEPGMQGATTSQKARSWVRDHWQGESFMAIGQQDPVLGAPVMRKLRECIPGCPTPLEVPAAGHFVQEEGDLIALRACEAFGI